MKYLLTSLTILLLVGAGCAQKAPAPPTPPPTPPVPADADGLPDGMVLEPTSDYWTEITMEVGEKIWFSDGLSVELLKIDDSRCPEGVQCIWEGELAATFALAEESPSIWKDEILLTSNRVTKAETNGNVFSYVDATADTFTFIVTKTE